MMTATRAVNRMEPMSTPTMMGALFVPRTPDVAVLVLGVGFEVLVAVGLRVGVGMSVIVGAAETTISLLVPICSLFGPLTATRT